MLCLVHLTGPIASYTILLAIQYSRGPKTSPLSYAFDKAYCLDHYIIYLVGSFRVPYRTTKISGLFLPWRLERDSKFPLLRPVTFPSLYRHLCSARNLLQISADTAPNTKLSNLVTSICHFMLLVFVGSALCLQRASALSSKAVT